VVLLSPFAPHLAEECWNRLGHADTLAFEAWPAWVEAYTLASTVTYAIQVNGKLRGQVEVGADTPGAEAIALAKVQENVAKHLEGKQIVKEICVPQKLINFVVK
jgi:leucyl-tRNA synthetase